jgi:signal peptidase II
MKLPKSYIYAILALLGAGLLVLDQVSKEHVLQGYQQGHIPVSITSFFNIVLAWNKGVSFGFLSTNEAVMPYLLAGFSILVSVLLLVWLIRESVLTIRTGLVFIIAGGLGNAYDRLVYGAVVDFIQIHYQEWYFPAFNVADICINIGVGLVLIDLLFFSDQRSKKAS